MKQYLKKNYFFIKNSKIKHGFFTRLNGLSKKNFKSLNCNVSNGDDKEVVLKNRSIAMTNLNLDKKKLMKFLLKLYLRFLVSLGTLEYLILLLVIY